MAENKIYGWILSLSWYDVEKQAYMENWQMWVKGEDEHGNLILTDNMEEVFLFDDSEDAICGHFYALIDSQYPKCEVFLTPLISHSK